MSWKPKSILLWIFFVGFWSLLQGQATPTVIHGKVSIELNPHIYSPPNGGEMEPIPGAIVFSPILQQGTIADLDGNFKLELETCPPYLVSKSVGFHNDTLYFSSLKDKGIGPEILWNPHLKEIEILGGPVLIVDPSLLNKQK